MTSEKPKAPLLRYTKVETRKDAGVETRWWWVRDEVSALVLQTEVLIEASSQPADVCEHYNRLAREVLAAHYSMAGGHPCEFIPCGQCNLTQVNLSDYMIEGIQAASRGEPGGILAKFGNPKELEQPEPFWVELERIFEERVRLKPQEEDEQPTRADG